MRTRKSFRNWTCNEPYTKKTHICEIFKVLIFCVQLKLLISGEMTSQSNHTALKSFQSIPFFSAFFEENKINPVNGL